MKKIIIFIITSILCVNYSFGQEEKNDTIGYYEIVESFNSGRSYLTKVPILKDSTFLRLSTTSSPYSNEALVFDSDTDFDFKSVFETKFNSFIADNPFASETVVKDTEPIKASGFFTQAGEEHYSLIKQEIKVSYVAVNSNGSMSYNIMLQIPEFESFMNSVFKTQKKIIFITETGAEMLLDSL